MKKRYFVLFLCSSFIQANNKLAIVFVIDGFSYEMLQKVKPYLNNGIKFLLDNGMVYEQAYYHHASPTTAPGHAGLNTGTPPRVHGIIDNSWFDKQGNKIACDSDSVEHAAVFSPTGEYSFGKSAHYLKADGVSDQLSLASTDASSHIVCAFSYKSRAAILLAGRMGKAIWFDDLSGNFTTSKAYFKSIPEWVRTFNKRNKTIKYKTITWPLFYPRTNRAYAFAYSKNYQFSLGLPLVGKASSLGTENDPYACFLQNPKSNKVLLDLAIACFDEYIQHQPNQLLLWVSLSSLDKIGHRYGPESIEYIDTIYHLDQYLHQFITYITQKAHGYETLFILTSDHGLMPIPELLYNKGFTLAGRINRNELRDQLNEQIKEKFNINQMVKEIDPPSIYLDQEKLHKLKQTEQKKLIAFLKQQIHKQKGIKNVWSFNQLEKRCFRSNEIETLYQNQLFAGRSGTLQFQVFPYICVTKTNAGTVHSGPYNYDRHVPLMLYQKGIKTKKLTQPVSMLQVPITLARFFDITKPSASQAIVLPKTDVLFDMNNSGLYPSPVP